MTTHEDVTNDFSFHPANEVTGPVHEAIRQGCAALAHRFVELLPEGNGKQQAMAALRTTMMFANAAVATQHDPAWQAKVQGLLPIPLLGLVDAEAEHAALEIKRLADWFMQDEPHQSLVGEGSAVANAIRLLGSLVPTRDDQADNEPTPGQVSSGPPSPLAEQYGPMTYGRTLLNEQGADSAEWAKKDRQDG